MASAAAPLPPLPRRSSASPSTWLLSSYPAPARLRRTGQPGPDRKPRMGRQGPTPRLLPGGPPDVMDRQLPGRLRVQRSLRNGARPARRRQPQVTQPLATLGRGAAGCCRRLLPPTAARRLAGEMLMERPTCSGHRPGDSYPSGWMSSCRSDCIYSLRHTVRCARQHPGMALELRCAPCPSCSPSCAAASSAERTRPHPLRGADHRLKALLSGACRPRLDPELLAVAGNKRACSSLSAPMLQCPRHVNESARHACATALRRYAARRGQQWAGVALRIDELETEGAASLDPPAPRERLQMQLTRQQTRQQRHHSVDQPATTLSTLSCRRFALPQGSPADPIGSSIGLLDGHRGAREESQLRSASTAVLDAQWRIAPIATACHHPGASHQRLRGLVAGSFPSILAPDSPGQPKLHLGDRRALDTSRSRLIHNLPG